MHEQINEQTNKNPSGEIFTSLVNRELGDSCGKCGNSDRCIIPNDGIPPSKDGTMDGYVTFWERYIADPTLIKKELHMHCHECNGPHE